MNGANYSERKINFGVPQGTTLSPVLFIIHLNDIKLLKLKNKIVCYADDPMITCVEICIGI